MEWETVSTCYVQDCRPAMSMSPAILRNIEMTSSSISAMLSLICNLRAGWILRVETLKHILELEVEQKHIVEVEQIFFLKVNTIVD